MDFEITNDELDPEKELDRPVSELTRRVYNAIIRASKAQSERAKATLAEVQETLVELAGIVNQAWMHEQRVTNMRAPQEIKISELIPIVREATIEMFLEKVKYQGANVGQVELLTERKSLMDELDKARQRIHTLEQINARHSDEIEHLKGLLASDARSNDQRKLEPMDILAPENYAQHRQDILTGEYGDTMSMAVLFIGKADMCLSPDFRRHVANQLDISDGRSEKVTKIIKTVQDLGLIYVAQWQDDGKSPSKPGPKPEVFSLTPFGEYYYEEETGEKPKRTNYVSEHKGEVQAYLAIQAEKLLEKMGYEIMRPSRLQVGSHLFLPDITAVQNGETIYAEVERNTPKGNQDQDQKWRNFRHFTNGRMYVFYEGGKAQHQALNRLATTAMMGQPNDVTFFCDLSKAESHWEKTGSIWTSSHKGV